MISRDRATGWLPVVLLVWLVALSTGCTQSESQPSDSQPPKSQPTETAAPPPGNAGGQPPEPAAPPTPPPAAAPVPPGDTAPEPAPTTAPPTTPSTRPPSTSEGSTGGQATAPPPGSTTSGANPRSGESLPSFPWPPPRYSAFSAISRDWVAPGAHPTLGLAARRLEQAFDTSGYGERSYYQVPGGFALVSRIEQMHPDATPFPSPERWAVETPRLRNGFIDYIRALFNAPPGFYRLIVFAVTDHDFSAAERPPTSAEARGWITAGALRLPSSIAQLPYTAQHYTTALIYEFERSADESEARVRTPGGSPGRTHLERTGLWQSLSLLQ